MQIFLTLLKDYGLYILCFILGAVLFNGCGDEVKTETITVEKPVPTIEYVDRWKTDTVRFVQRSTRIDTIRDTLTHEVIEVRLDTMLKVDTLEIVKAWLTELVKYDTTLNFKGGDIRLTWQNYQNLSENLSVTLSPKKGGRPLGIILYGKVGTRSDFVSNYAGNVGGGLLFEKKRFIFGPDYSYNGQHNINAILGYRLR